jgi:hypothetical protein
MRSDFFALLMVGSLFLSAWAEAASAPVPAATVRKSADGLDLPTAGAERKFHVKIALGGAILGEKPDEVGRVFGTRKSALLLAKHTRQDLGCDWFVLNSDGADVLGLGLTDGRVSKLVLVAPAAKVAKLSKQLETYSNPLVRVTIKPIEEENKPSLIVQLEVDPVEFYLATHTIDGRVADAMRRRTWLAEMTDEQALLIGDGPGKYLATFAPDSSVGGVGAGTVFAESTAADVRLEIQARSKQDAREQAASRHKNLKTIVKIVPDGGAGDKGK